MRRFFTEPQNIENGIINITDDAAHITRVLRMQVGDEILVFDGTGLEYAASLTQIDKNVCRAKVLSSKKSEYEPEIRVTLFQGIPKSGKFEQIVQKAVELGVYEVCPVSMHRCVAKIENDKKGAGKIERLQKVAVEAAKQCGRGIVPAVSMPVDFKEAVKRLKNMALAIMPYEILGHEGSKGLKELLIQNQEAGNIGILIGPEGGFADFEAEYAVENEVNTVGLGKRILRTETAGSTVLSIIMYEYNQF